MAPWHVSFLCKMWFPLYQLCTRKVNNCTLYSALYPMMHLSCPILISLGYGIFTFIWDFTLPNLSRDLKMAENRQTSNRLCDKCVSSTSRVALIVQYIVFTMEQGMRSQVNHVTYPSIYSLISINQL